MATLYDPPSTSSSFEPILPLRVVRAQAKADCNQPRATSDEQQSEQTADDAANRHSGSQEGLRRLAGVIEHTNRTPDRKCVSFLSDLLFALDCSNVVEALTRPNDLLATDPELISQFHDVGPDGTRASAS